MNREKVVITMSAKGAQNLTIIKKSLEGVWDELTSTPIDEVDFYILPIAPEMNAHTLTIELERLDMIGDTIAIVATDESTIVGKAYANYAGMAKFVFINPIFDHLVPLENSWILMCHGPQISMGELGLRYNTSKYYRSGANMRSVNVFTPLPDRRESFASQR